MSYREEAQRESDKRYTELMLALRNGDDGDTRTTAGGVAALHLSRQLGDLSVAIGGLIDVILEAKR